MRNGTSASASATMPTHEAEPASATSAAAPPRGGRRSGRRRTQWAPSSDAAPKGTSVPGRGDEQPRPTADDPRRAGCRGATGSDAHRRRPGARSASGVRRRRATPSGAPSAAERRRPARRSRRRAGTSDRPRAPAGGRWPRRGRRVIVASQRAVVQLHALAGALDAPRRRAGAARPGDGQLERVVAEADAHVDVGRVLERVEQVLDDPVGRQLDPGRAARAGCPRRVSRAPAPLARTSSASRWVSVGCGAVGAAASSLAQHADDRAHLLERAAALALDVGERRRGGVGVRSARAGVRQRAPSSPRRRCSSSSSSRRQPRPVGRDLEAGALVARRAQLGGARPQLRRPCGRASARRGPMPQTAAVSGTNSGRTSAPTARRRASRRTSQVASRAPRPMQRLARGRAAAPAENAQQRTSTGKTHAAADDACRSSAVCSSERDRGRRRAPPAARRGATAAAGSRAGTTGTASHAARPHRRAGPTFATMRTTPSALKTTRSAAGRDADVDRGGHPWSESSRLRLRCGDLVAHAADPGPWSRRAVVTRAGEPRGWPHPGG